MTRPVGPHPHHLGEWDSSAAVVLATAEGAWRAPTPDELAALVGERGAWASVFTLPAWPGRELAAIDWSDGSPEGDATERTQFERYGARVAEFVRFLGAPLADRTGVKLVATTSRASAPDATAAGGAVLVNAGEAPLLVAMTLAGRCFAVVVRPGEGCALAAEARPWAVALAESSEFGLHLELPTE